VIQSKVWRTCLNSFEFWRMIEGHHSSLCVEVIADSTLAQLIVLLVAFFYTLSFRLFRGMAGSVDVEQPYCGGFLENQQILYIILHIMYIILHIMYIIHKYCILYYILCILYTNTVYYTTYYVYYTQILYIIQHIMYIILYRLYIILHKLYIIQHIMYIIHRD